MSDLQYDVGVNGLADFDRLLTNLEKLDRVLANSKGSGKALEQTARIINGMKGQAPIFQQLADSVKGLEKASNSLAANFGNEMKMVTTTLNRELKVISATLATQLHSIGIAAGGQMGKGMSEGITASEGEVIRRTRSLAAKARAEATKAYEAMVGQNANLKLSNAQMGQLFDLKEQGANISAYHRKILEQWIKSSKDTFAAIKVSSSKDAAEAAQATAKAYAMEMARSRQLFAGFEASIGLDKAATVKSAKDSASVFALAYAEELARSKQTLRAFEQSLGLDKAAVVKSAKQSAAVFAEAYERELARSRSMVRTATMTTESPYSVVATGAVRNMPAAPRNSGGGLDAQVLNRTRKEADLLSASFDRLSVSGNDVHSMSRGLASGFNLLWLTWGNLGPLFIGAAISNGFMKTARDGMQVAHTLEIIAALGENTAEQMQLLTGNMIDLGYSGIRGPKELAEAFKVLSLAGLKANEVLAVTGTVLNFSVAGTTEIETAADVLVSVTTAFGTGAAGFERSADIIARAAADSKASVESFGEAMKTASVVGEQYGARQEDVALQIQYLAQLGIQGSAAGTAVRNMYADITGRSGQVTKILKSFGLDFKDAEGNVVSLTEQMRLLDGVLKQYDAKSQGNIIQGIFGERGAKSAIATLQAYRAAASDSSKYANKLEEDFARVSAASGDAAINAAKLAQTTLNSFKAAGAAFETTLFQAYQEIEPQLYSIGVALRDAFSSPEAQEGITRMVRLIADLGVVVADSLPTLIKLGVAWGAYKLAITLSATALAAVDGVLKRNIANKIALASATTAAAEAEKRYAAMATAAGAATALSASNALKGLAGVARVLPGIGTAVTVAAVGWSLYDAWMTKAGTSADRYANEKSESILGALRKENEHIEAVNNLRAQGISLIEAEARVKAENARSSAAQDSITAGASIQTELAKAEADLEALLSKHDPSARIRAQNTLYAKQTAHVQELREKLSGVQEESAKITLQLEAEEARRRKNAQESARLAEEETKRMREGMKLQGGNLQWNLADFQGGGGGRNGPRERANLERDNELKAIQAHYDEIIGVETDAYNRRKKIMDARRSGELMSEEQYLVGSFQMATEYEQKQVALLVESSERYLEVFAERQQRMREAMEASNDPRARSMYAEALEREQNDAAAQMAKNAAAIEKIKAEAAERIELSYIALEAAAGKLVKTDREFWEGRGRDLERDKEAVALERAYDNISTSVFSLDTAFMQAAKAQQQVRRETEEHISKLREQLRIQLDSLELQKQELELASMRPDVGPDQLNLMQEGIKRTEKFIASIRGSINEATEKGIIEGLDRAEMAFAQARYQQFIGLRDSLTEITLEGLTGSGKEAGRRLRNLLQQELLMKPLTVVVNGIFGQLLGSVFGFGGGGGVGGMAGAGSSILGLASNASTAYSLFTGNSFLNTLGGWLGIGGASATGLGLSAATGAGIIGSGIGAGLGLGGGAAAGTGLGLSLGGGGLGLTAGSSGAGLIGAGVGGGAGAGGTGLLSAIPGWGWALGAGALILGNIFGRKTEKRGYGLMGTLGEEGGVHNLDLMRKGGSLFGGPKWFVKDTGVSEMDKKLQETYKLQRKALMEMGDALGLATDHVKDFTTQIGTDELGDKKVRGIRLDGLSDEEAQAKIAEALATANNEIAEQIIGTWRRTSREVERIDISRPTDVGDTTDYGTPNVIRETIEEATYIPSEYAREGEKAIDTLTRLATSLTGVNAIFDMLNLALYDASLAAGDAASSFVDLFGGLENLNALAGTYYENFYSEEERKAKAREGLDKVFDDLGLEKINYDDDNARQQFRELVEKEQARMIEEQKARENLRNSFTELVNIDAMPEGGSIGDVVRGFLDDTVGELEEGAIGALEGLISDFDTGELTLEGFTGSVIDLIGASDDAGTSAEETVAALLRAAGAFAEVTESSEDAARRRAEEEAEEERKAQEALDRAFRNLQAATDRQLKAIDAQRQTLKAQRDSAAESLSLITSVFDLLHSNVRELYGQVESTAQMQAVQGFLFIEDALRAARATGALPEVDALSEAIRAARDGLNNGIYVSQFERDRDTLVLAGQLSELEEISGRQKTIEEQQLDELDKQLEELDKQSRLLQEQLEKYREQIEISRGTYDATISLEQAVRDIEALLKPDTPAEGGEGSGTSKPPAGQPVFGGGGGARDPEEKARYYRMRSGGTAGVMYEGIRDKALIDRLDKLSPVYHAFDGTNDLAGLHAAFSAAGGTISDLSILSGNWERDWIKAFADIGLPSFDVGTNYVPKNMLAQIHEGEAILPKAFNPWANGGGLQYSTLEMVTELQAVREEVTNLLRIVAVVASNTAGLPQMVDQFDEVTEGGNALRSDVVNTVEVKVLP